MVPISHVEIASHAGERTGGRNGRSPAVSASGRGQRRRFPVRLIDLVIVSAVFLFLAAVMFGVF